MNSTISSPKETNKEHKLEEIMGILPPHLRTMIASLSPDVLKQLEEIRLRLGRPLALIGGNGYRYLDAQGKPDKSYVSSYVITKEDMDRTLQLVSGSSLYALEEELKNGFVTVPGGHRVGLTGKVVLEGGRVKTLKYITGLNLRLAREILGAADAMMPRIIDKHKGILHTMIFSPPGCGKTTILRDVVRQISNGIPALGFDGITVGLVDERSEVAGCCQGIPSMDVGINTDVLDGCPKAEGMLMLLRSMSPRVIATDELGKEEDVRALEEVLNAGVRVIFTVHGSSLAEITARPALQYLLNLGIVERFVKLGRKPFVGSIESVQ